jgi:hypothetical protein
MNKATQETATEVKTLSITDENISQADFERLRNGETIEVEESAPGAKEASSKTVDESDTSKPEESESDGDEESDTNLDDEASEDVKPKKKSGTQRRIEKLVKQRSEVERERDYLREQLLKAQGQKPPEAKEASKVEATSAPKPDDFDSYDDYVSARIKHEAKELRAAEKAEEESKRRVEERKSRADTHNKRVDDYRKDNPEFDENLADFFEDQGTNFNLSMALEELITESDIGAKVLHELVKNPTEFVRINSLGAMGVAREIGRLEAKLSNTPQSKTTEVTKTKTTTKAPPPARPLNASSANGKKSLTDVAESGSQAEWDRMRNEQEKRRRASF